MASRLSNEEPNYDRYDLRYDRSPSSSELNSTSAEIRTHYQTLEFLRKCTTHLIGVLSGVKIPRNPDHRAFPRRNDRPNERDTLLREKAKLNRWEIDVAQREVWELMCVILRGPSPTVVGGMPMPDFLLYRVHNAQTKCMYDPRTGIRCSAWADTLLLDEVDDPVGTRFRNHMNFSPYPSPYISVHASAARMVKLILSYGSSFTRDPLARVLRKLGIEAWCSEDGIRRWGLRKGGGGDGLRVSYVTKSHWLIEGWVPEGAVVGEMRVGEFLDTAEKCGITRDRTMGAVWSEEVEARVIPGVMIPARRAWEEASAGSTALVQPARQISGSMPVYAASSQSQALVPVRYQAANDGISGLEAMFSTMNMKGSR
ncbi:hypothetical protein CJF32_00003226 [Rutstroemia sp. NJR-2017a WRK4]|nr:hypothetical protein CJF32_00003226 [Rutstroemia sp. NJR-2017a WRK4]